MANGITGIDHTIIGVEDLEASRDRFDRLGFTLTPRGTHIGWGTANYCIMFPETYFELLGVVDASIGSSSGFETDIAEHGEGLIGVALASDDGEAAYAEMQANGLNPDQPRALARNLELPEATVQPEFRLVQIADQDSPAVKTFLCQHLTPEMVRRPEWLHHANGANGIAHVTVVVPDPEALLAPYEKLFGAGSAAVTDDTVAVHTGKGTILFVTADDLAMLYPKIEHNFRRPQPFIAAMGIEVADSQATADYLAANQVPYYLGYDQSVRVPPDQAGGAILEFAAPVGPRLHR